MKLGWVPVDAGIPGQGACVQICAPTLQVVGGCSLRVADSQRERESMSKCFMPQNQTGVAEPRLGERNVCNRTTRQPCA
jgi:hypothetical protein